jgi:hypothetical protein
VPDGQLRRAPQLWEQRLARTTAILGAGISSSGDATAIVPPSPPPGTGGGTEPAPVAPAPGLFIAPSTPTLIGSVQGINVVWNGLNSAGDLWPSDTSYVEVHMSTAGTGFTPDSSTLKGRLARPGGLAVTGLSSGVTYHFRLRGADAAGNYTTAGSAASGTTGLISGPDIAANAITANSIVAGTITGWSINAAYLSGGTISGGFITGGTVSGGFITGGTVSGALVTGGTIQSSTGNRRIAITSGDTIDFYYDNVKRFDIAALDTADGYVAGFSAGLDVDGGLEVNAADVDMPGVYDNDTGTAIDNVGITAGFRLRRKSSRQAVKYDIATLTQSLSDSVDEARKSDVTTVDPSAVLDVSVVEFSAIEQGEPTDIRVLGFIAEDVADKLPIAVTRLPDGSPAGVADTPMIAAILAVVQDQAANIEDLRARIEALEA